MHSWAGPLSGVAQLIAPIQRLEHSNYAIDLCAADRYNYNSLPEPSTEIWYSTSKNVSLCHFSKRIFSITGSASRTLSALQLANRSQGGLSPTLGSQHVLNHCYMQALLIQPSFSCLGGWVNHKSGAGNILIFPQSYTDLSVKFGEYLKEMLRSLSLRAAMLWLHEDWRVGPFPTPSQTHLLGQLGRSPWWKKPPVVHQGKQAPVCGCAFMLLQRKVFCSAPSSKHSKLLLSHRGCSKEGCMTSHGNLSDPQRVMCEGVISTAVILLLGSHLSCVLKTKAGLGWAGIAGLGKNAGKYHCSPHSPPQ